MVEQNDTTSAISQQEGDTAYQELILQIEHELTNNDLQVYITGLKDIDGLKSRLANLLSQVYLQVWMKAQTERSLLTSDVVRVLFMLSKDEKTSNEILKRAKMDTLYKLRRYILNPAISAGYVEMSNPEKPTSSKQTYRLTHSGASIIGSGS